MSYLRAFLVLLPVLATAATVPDRYIVELTGEPVATRLPRTTRRIDFTTTTALRVREEVRAEQRRTRRDVERHRAQVVDSVDTVANALIVHASEREIANLERVPGVKRVLPVRVFRRLLDQALIQHGVPGAWSMIGYDKAGTGVKVGIIDTGVEVSHPGFQDPSLPVPIGFPKVSQESDLEHTNNKIIVARSYSRFFRRPDPDNSASDRDGHGTATAMAAAGVSATAPLAVISGVAPKAWIGSYKVFGSPGTNDTATEDALIKAIDDAVADGMDVINLSLGSDIAPLPENDLQVQALERAASAGVIVVAAAGNNGPDPNTISSPSTAPSTIAVGASVNGRVFSGSALIEGLPLFLAMPGAGPSPPQPVSGPLVDVSQLDRNGLACSALPPNSLAGRVALIARGTCFFEDKLNTAQQAGAIAALIYTDSERPTPITMSVGSASLPASMVSYWDGLRIKEALAKENLTVTIRFTTSAVAVSSEGLGDFSGRGPSVNKAIKPDLVAVGTRFYTAAQKLDSQGDLFDSSGFRSVQGTSFSAPLVAGAAALLKSARPGLTAAQYRSLLVNTADTAYSALGVFASIQQSGTGSLDMGAAIRTTVAAAPVSLSFGSGGPDVSAVRTLTISNTGTEPESYTISIIPRTGGPVPEIASSTAELQPGWAVDLPVRFNGSSLHPSQYEGVIAIQGNTSGTWARVPYWYGVASGIPRYITILNVQTEPQAGATVSDVILFRVTDEAGIPVEGADPTVTVVSGGGEVLELVRRNRISPDMLGLRARMGPRAGSNTFRIEAGGITRDVTVVTR